MGAGRVEKGETGREIYTQEAGRETHRQKETQKGSEAEKR